MAILVTGGAGYIGSHTSVELLNAGYEVVIVDNLSNSEQSSINRIEMITGKTVTFYPYDLLDIEKMEQIFIENDIEAVIHFAGLKAVGDSVKFPLEYYRQNVFGTIILCKLMEKHEIKKLVFSSSATVYGHPKSVPIREDASLMPISPYGRTKLMIEEILRDLYIADRNWSIAILRYFNPIGAHKSGLIGDNPQGVPNNLLPFITRVAVGSLPDLKVFGNDYPTADGTGVRDYIHVVDLAEGHLKALQFIMKETGTEAFNLGTGKGYSVLQVIEIFEKITGVKISYEVKEKREGDVPEYFADPHKAERILRWQSRKTIEDMCEDAWKWEFANCSNKR